jgi:hypothetical protein
MLWDPPPPHKNLECFFTGVLQKFVNKEKLHGRPKASVKFTNTVKDFILCCCSGTMSLKTGEHATLTSKDQVEALLKAKFTGVPEHWIPDIAEQVLKEQPSPAGG